MLEVRHFQNRNMKRFHLKKDEIWAFQNFPGSCSGLSCNRYCRQPGCWRHGSPGTWAGRKSWVPDVLREKQQLGIGGKLFLSTKLEFHSGKLFSWKICDLLPWICAAQQHCSIFSGQQFPNIFPRLWYIWDIFLMVFSTEMLHAEDFAAHRKCWARWWSQSGLGQPPGGLGLGTGLAELVEV